MKFRIITTVILFVVLGLAYVVYESNQPGTTQSTPSGSGGIVLQSN